MTLLIAGLLDVLCQLASGSLLHPIPETLLPSPEALAWAKSSEGSLPPHLWDSVFFLGVIGLLMFPSTLPFPPRTQP